MEKIEIQTMAFDLLAQVCKVSKEDLSIALYKTRDYRSIIISKRNGGKRELLAPADEVLLIQRRLLKNVFYKFIQKNIRLDPYFFQDHGIYINSELTGFMPGKSYVTNGIIHTEFRSNYILKLDLENAFPSVRAKDIEKKLIEAFSWEIRNYETAHEVRKKFFAILQFGKDIVSEFGQPPSGDKIELKAWKYNADNKLKKFLESEGDSLGYCDHPANREFSRLTAWDVVVKLREFNWRKYYPKFPIFPNGKCYSFRKLIREEDDDLSDSFKIINEFVSLVIRLVTYDGVLPQGAATSGFLFNFVLSQLGIVDKIVEFVSVNTSKSTISMYADDLIIGFVSKPSDYIIKSIVKIIGKDNVFKVNKEKTKLFNRASVAPPITGFKLVRRRARMEEIENDIKAQIPGAKKRKEKGGVWLVDRISLSKKVQKKIRGLIYHATLNEVDEEIHSKICGYLGLVVQAYGNSFKNIPNQLSIPIKKYGEKYNKLKNFTE